MLETRYRAARALPLGALSRSAPASSGVSVRPAGAEARFSLRARLAAGAAPKVAGLALDAPINTVGTDGEVWLARLGPDEWLVGGPEADADLLQGRIHEALAGLPHSLVDVSHRNVGIDVSGRQAAAVLNAGCPLDLSEAAFPPGSATRTLLGKSEIVLIRATAAPLYRVECWRSFSTYVHGFLNEAVFGVEESAAH
ncbi:sarcosine oxidase subunit gamma [Methylorubrum extorquens]|uniref:sarcosine oxidase subunit gamma n=1 Tax=Methylorubrum extorquens TaxID=408 RepID=UPI000158F7B3|nr:sarcosine oxidase subunit gamma family protein [Methylorubrum extorquens]ABY32113.1 Sarcosine oxidase gamma subunit [Methylorubrum extorquens PA1]KQP95240.1 sarcosine oxidase subunit gamma [Methylobacterium sp. Leaf119]WIU38721.1 sarcosine oxidase subunit gamma [Methylorubrum extorquens]